MHHAVKVAGLGKQYQRGMRERVGRTFRETLVDLAKAPFRRLRGLSGLTSDGSRFWALKDVSFEVKPGEVVGIIGRNGAGKSTLLKVLSRITEPTTGRAEIRGRVASLLEVGTGFHSELTGRENVYLNGAILGMTKKEINRKFDEIVAFSGVESFIDTPIKRYSSGMKVRLAFAVAAHLEPEIFVVDEVLAVGDYEFQRKCLGKMQDVARDGRTVLFVSHDLAAVRTLCNCGLVLRDGRVDFRGAIEDCIDHYTKSDKLATSEWNRCPDEHAECALQFCAASLELLNHQPCHALRVSLRMESNGGHRPGFIALDILNAHHRVVMQALPTSTPFLEETSKTHDLAIDVALPPLIPGTYFVTLWVGSAVNETIDYVHRVLAFDITESPIPNHSFAHSHAHGSIMPPSNIARYESA